METRFKIVEIVGSGSYGVVYRAEDLHIPGALWAIKEIREKSIDERERSTAVRHFIRETMVFSPPVHIQISERTPKKKERQLALSANSLLIAAG